MAKDAQGVAVAEDHVLAGILDGRKAPPRQLRLEPRASDDPVHGAHLTPDDPTITGGARDKDPPPPGLGRQGNRTVGHGARPPDQG